MIDEKLLADLRASQEEEGTEFSLADLIAVCDGNADEGKEYYQALNEGEKKVADSPTNTVQINLDNDITNTEINQDSDVTVQPSNVDTNEIVQPSNVDTDVTVQPSNDNFDKMLDSDFRGISIDTYRHYGCSYDISERRIVIPTVLPDGTKSYVKVLTQSARDSARAKGLKYAKVKAEEGKPRGIFNLDKIVPDQPVLICEGEIDALSIIQAGYSNVIGLGGTNNQNNLIAWLNKNPAEYQFVILFDNDKEGIADAPELVAKLLRAGYKAVCDYVSPPTPPDYDNKVDCNDILLKGESNLRTRINLIIDTAQVEFPNIDFPPPEPPKVADVCNFDEEPNKYPPISQAEMLKILDCIPDELSYSDWCMVCCALIDWGKSINNLDLALQFFIAKSSKDKDKFSDKVCNDKWNSFLNSGKKLAQANGYVLPQNDIQSIFSDSRGFKIPRGYHMTRNYISVDVKDTQKIIATAPFYISAYYCKNTLPDNTYCADITTITNKSKVKTIQQIPLGDLADARKIAPLANFNLPFSSTNAKFIVDYISAFIAVNSNILQEIDLHKKLGWTEDNIFISPYDDTFAIDKDNTLAGHLRVKGNSAKWLSTVKKVFDTSLIGRAIFSASLASLILPVIGCRAFVVYLRCKSKAGKSAAFKLAASSFGDSQILKSLNATPNSLEGVIADISPFPAIFDERQVAGGNFDISNFVYRAGGGQGRGRCNTDGTLKDIKIWKNAKTQGIHTRTLELDFTGDKIMPDDLAQDIHIDFDTGKSFGHGAKIFLDNLRGECIDNLSEMYKSLSKDFKNKYPDYVDDHCRYIAAITVADFLALKYLFNFEPDQALKSAKENAANIFELIGTQKELSDEEKEKEFILNWVSGERLHFDGMQGYEEKLVTPIYGCTGADGLFINVTYLKKACKEAGYSYSKLKTDLINAGVFVETGGEVTVQKWISKKCYAVKLSDEYVTIPPPPARED